MIISHFWKTCHFFFKVYLQYRVAELTSCQLFFSCLFLNIKLYSMKMWNYWYMRWTSFMQANVFYDDIYKWNSLLQISKLAWKRSSQFMVFYLKAHMWKAISTLFHNKYNELSTTVWNQTSAVSSLRTQNKKQQQKTMP